VPGANGDLFRTIRNGQADVVTDTSTVSPRTGVLLNSGEELQADIHHHRNEFDLRLFGAAGFFATAYRGLTESMTYKGMDADRMPNHGVTIG